MKKLIAVVGALLFAGSTFAVAAVPSLTATKIKNSKLAQGPVVVNMDGTKISVPQGQTVIIGKRDNGSIVVRGLNLNNVKIPEKLETIGSEAFESCENLLSLQLPASVFQIEADAFSNCRHLMLFVYPGSYSEEFAKYRDMLFSEV